MKDSGGLFPFRLAWLIPVAARGHPGARASGAGWPARSRSTMRSTARWRCSTSTTTPTRTARRCTDWRFRVGRWTGAGVVFSSLLALAALLHEHLATALARWTKQAVVVIGGAPAGAGARSRPRAAPAAARSGWAPPAFGSAGFRDIALAWPPRERTRAVLRARPPRRPCAGRRARRRRGAGAGQGRPRRRAGRPDHRADARHAPGRRRRRDAERAAAPGCWPRPRSRPGRSAIAHPPFLIARERGHGAHPRADRRLRPDRPGDRPRPDRQLPHHLSRTCRASR